MEDEDLTRDELAAEHAALKHQVQALSTAHQRLRRTGSTSAERLVHRMRLRQNVVELERHYGRLHRAAMQRR